MPIKAKYTLAGEEEYRRVDESHLINQASRGIIAFGL
jgi:hypothetical protein